MKILQVFDMDSIRYRLIYNTSEIENVEGEFLEVIKKILFKKSEIAENYEGEYPSDTVFFKFGGISYGMDSSPSWVSEITAELSKCKKITWKEIRKERKREIEKFKKMTLTK